ncbi:MAG: pseudouridine synthase [Myxococcota bacterium]|jgi:23S rRNA pseudouridine2605 synthase|nr:pseudouridine synthase [Myxococcota bacterium]
MAHGQSPRHVRKRKAMDTPAEDGSAIRLQRIVASAGLASRRGAEELIRDGRVSVNGRTATLGESADPTQDVVMVDGERLRSEKPRYWMLHKPNGVVTTVSDPHGRETVMHLVPEGVGSIHPVGRLDRDSSGLVLLTNDGDLTQRLLHPSHESEKEYRVTVKGELGPDLIEKIQSGLYLEDGKTAPAKLNRLRADPDTGTSTFFLTLIEGRKRQIRRMMLAVGRPVKKLARVRMGPLVLGRLAVGKSRPLRAEEIKALKTHAARLKDKAPRRQRAARKGRSSSPRGPRRD